MPMPMQLEAAPREHVAPIVHFLLGPIHRHVDNARDIEQRLNDALRSRNPIIMPMAPPSPAALLVPAPPPRALPAPPEQATEPGAPPERQYQSRVVNIEEFDDATWASNRARRSASKEPSSSSL